MTEEELLDQLRAEILIRFQELSDEEKDIMRQNKGTPYERIIRKVIGEELLLGLGTRQRNDIPVRRRGLATR